MKNYCRRCEGFGVIKDPTAKRWQFWKRLTCPICAGDGYARPPSPDNRPIPPPPPPPVPLKDRIKIELSCPLTKEQEAKLTAFIKGEVKKAIYECIDELKVEYGVEQ